MENMTQLARVQYDRVLQTHHKPWFPWLNHHCLHETITTDTMFTSVLDISGNTCAQVYWGLTLHYINVYGMQTESDGPQTLDNLAREEGVPPVMHSDNSHMQRWGSGWLKHMHDWLCQAEYTKPYHPQQNPAEMCAIKYLKTNSKMLRQCTGAPPETWLLACQYLSNVHNITTDETIDWKTPWHKQQMETPKYFPLPTIPVLWMGLLPRSGRKVPIY